MNRKLVLTSVAWCGSLAAAWWIGSRSALTQAGAGATTELGGPAAAGGIAKTTNEVAAGGGSVALTTPGDKTQAMVSWYQRSTVPPAERMEKILQLDDQFERMTAYLELLGSLKTDEEMTGAFQVLMKNFDGRGRGRELSMLMSKWAITNPEAALAESVKLKDWSGQYAAGTVLATWVKSNPDAAKAWALANHKAKEGDEEGNWYMVGVISGLSKSDPALAAQWAQEQPRSRARGEMMDRIVDAMTKNEGVEAAQSWVNSLPEGPFRNGVTRKVAWKLTEKDPVASAAWIESIPSKDARNEAMRDLVDRWAEIDANAAGQWLQKFPPAPEMDESRRTFAWEIREKDPESAVAWAGTVQDQRQRDRLMVELLRDWSRRDKNAAQGYMQRNNWPAETQSKVFN